jgi:gliding motility-associated-like protein
MKKIILLFLLFVCLKCDINAHDGTSNLQTFIENKGQFENEVLFKSSLTSGVGDFYILKNGFLYNFIDANDWAKAVKANHDGVKGDLWVNHHAYMVNFINSNLDFESTGHHPSAHYYNYFLSNDKSKWASKVRAYERVNIDEIYPGINLKVYNDKKDLKYDFVVTPGANPNFIQLSFDGISPKLTSNGDLEITTSVNKVIEKKPYCYQLINGAKIEVVSRYVLKKNILSFDFPNGYNPNFELIIDPQVIFSTYSGGTGASYSHSSTPDIMGNMYAMVQTFGPGWPTQLGSFQANYAGGNDVGINKYSADGTRLEYATYFGGSGEEYGFVSRVNNANQLVIAGTTGSANLPLATSGFNMTYPGGTRCMYIAKFSEDGTQLLAATYYGNATSVASYFTFSTTSMGFSAYPEHLIPGMELNFDVNDNIWFICNVQSDVNIPISSNAFQLTKSSGWDANIVKFTPDLVNILYSSYLGGSGDEVVHGIELLSNGNPVIVGATTSTDFPIMGTNPHTAIYPGGNMSGFAAIINENSGQLEYATYIGTSQSDIVSRVDVDRHNNIFILGRTTGHFTFSPNVYTNITDTTTNDKKLFVHKYNSTLSERLLATAFKGGTITPGAFLVDDCSNVYFTSMGAGAGMPMSFDAFQTQTDDMWFAALDGSMQELIFGTYYGDPNVGDHCHTGTNRFDKQGRIYHSMCVSTASWPTTQMSYSPTKLSPGYDIASFKFDFDKSGVSSVFEPDRLSTPMDSFCAPHTVQFLNNSTSAREFIWDFGDGSPTSNLRTPTHTYTAAGIYEVKLISINDSMCITHDTSTMYVHVYEVQEPILSVVDTNLCVAVDSLLITVNLANPSMGVPGNIFRWTSPSAGAIYGPGNTQSVWVNPNLGSQFNVTVLDSAAAVCVTSANAMVNVNMKPRTLEILTPDTAVCAGDVVQIRARGSAGYTYRWSPTTGINNPNSLEPIITINQSQLYMVTASYPFCIDTSDMISIVMHEYPAVTIQAPNEACEGSEVEFTSSVTPYRNDYIYEWTPANLFTNNGLPNVSMIADTIDRQYGLKVSTPIGCSDSTAKIVIFHTKGNGDAISGVDYCAPGSAQLWASNGVSYEWSPQLGLDDPYSANPVTSTSTPIDYSVFITDEHGCIDTLQVVVDVHPRAMLSLPDSVTVYQGGSGYQVLPQTNAMYFEWFPQAGVSNPNLSDPVLNPIVNTRYIVTAKTEFGCEVVDSMDVVVGPAALNMPNAYNPNNPEAPLYKAVIKGGWELKSFKIYNRWGKLLFETSDLNEGWDGRYNNELQPMGVYVWGIEATSKEGETISNSGNVTLIR